MLISANLYSNTYNRLKVAKEQKLHSTTRDEHQTTDDLIKSLNQYLVVALILVIIEFLILLYALKLAIQCPRTLLMKIVHVIFALFFTLPYVIVMYLSGYCPTADMPKKVIVVQQRKSLRRRK
jgi:hypothetical protein